MLDTRHSYLLLPTPSILPALADQAPFLAEIAHTFGWRHVGIINGDGLYASGFAPAFELRCAELTVTDSS